MRKYWVGAFLLVGGSLALAQIFNLDDEDKDLAAQVSSSISGSAANNKGASLKQTIEIKLSDAPTATSEDALVFDKIYKEVVVALKANDIKKAQGVIAGYDVFTKQKIVDRLLKEDPNDFVQRVPADQEEGSLSLPPPTEVPLTEDALPADQ